MIPEKKSFAQSPPRDVADDTSEMISMQEPLTGENNTRGLSQKDPEVPIRRSRWGVGRRVPAFIIILYLSGIILSGGQFCHDR
jgi:hypothetical protein